MMPRWAPWCKLVAGYVANEPRTFWQKRSAVTRWSVLACTFCPDPTTTESHPALTLQVHDKKSAQQSTRECLSPYLPCCWEAIALLCFRASCETFGAFASVSLQATGSRPCMHYTSQHTLCPACL